MLSQFVTQPKNQTVIPTPQILTSNNIKKRAEYFHKQEVNQKAAQYKLANSLKGTLFNKTKYVLKLNKPGKSYTFHQKNIENHKTRYNRNRWNQQMKSKIEFAIFFDNDAEKIEEVEFSCNNIIQLVKIPESSEVIPEIDVSFLEQQFINKGEEKALRFYRYIKKLYGDQFRDTYDSESGIQEKHIQITNDWLEQTKIKGKDRAAIFDWDRTLTMFEGIYPLIDQLKNNEFNMEDYLCYLFGGDTRYYMIKSFLEDLNNKNIQIIILTNNGSCENSRYFDTNNKKSLNTFYEKMLNTFIKFNFTLICSRNEYNKNKGNAISQHDSRFSECIKKTEGGRTKRKSKGKKKSKKTRHF